MMPNERTIRPDFAGAAAEFSKLRLLKGVVSSKLCLIACSLHQKRSSQDLKQLLYDFHRRGLPVTNLMTIAQA